MIFSYSLNNKKDGIRYAKEDIDILLRIILHEK
jgi:hypothetical protein